MGQAACCAGPEGPFTAEVRAISVSGIREPTEKVRLEVALGTQKETTPVATYQDGVYVWQHPPKGSPPWSFHGSDCVKDTFSIQLLGVGNGNELPAVALSQLHLTEGQPKAVAVLLGPYTAKVEVTLRLKPAEAPKADAAAAAAAGAAAPTGGKTGEAPKPDSAAATEKPFEWWPFGSKDEKSTGDDKAASGAANDAPKPDSAAATDKKPFEWWPFGGKEEKSAADVKAAPAADKPKEAPGSESPAVANGVTTHVDKPERPAAPADKPPVAEAEAEAPRAAPAPDSDAPAKKAE